MTMGERRAATTTLVLACTAQFLVLFDTSVMTVALPSIRTDLRVEPGSLQWVVNGYTLTFAGLLLLGGRLADVHSHRRVFLGGLAVFTLTSLLGGLATSPAVLIAARTGQGAGAAVLAPLAITMLTTTFPEGPRRTRALTVAMAMALVGGASGNLLGGVLTELLTWRSVLLINVPIGIPVSILAAHALNRSTAPNGRRVRLDLPGAFLATVGLTTLTFGVSQIHDHGWAGPTVFVTLVGGLVALVWFVALEVRFAVSPLVPPRLFRLPGIGWGNLVMVLAGASQVPVWYFLTLTMQHLLGYSAVQTGLGFMPHAAVMLAVTLRVVPWLMWRVPAKTLIAVGATIGAIGFLWQSRITPESTYFGGILGPAILTSVGGGLVGTPLTRTVTAGVEPSDLGAASGLLNTTRQFGGAFGLAVLITVTTSEAPTVPTTHYGDAFLGIALIMLGIAALAPLLPSVRDSQHAPAR